MPSEVTVDLSGNPQVRLSTAPDILAIFNRLIAQPPGSAAAAAVAKQTAIPIS